MIHTMMILKNHYALIPEVYTTATPITIHVNPENEDEGLSSSRQERSGASVEDKKSYTLVRKHQPPPVPDKSSELQQHLDLRATAQEAAKMSNKWADSDHKEHFNGVKATKDLDEWSHNAFPTNRDQLF